MKPVRVKIEGLREVDAALQELKLRTARNITRKALNDGGEIIAQDMRARAPVDEGNLRESISVSGTLSRRQRGLHRKRSDQERFVGPDNRPAAHLREFGGDGYPPHPYARPAFDSKKEGALKRITDRLMVDVEQAVQRAKARGNAK
ncbi:MAG TPA: HK97-gp10 family putative phage morphogenesis protein [Pelagibacterium sp.]|uniref:HK97-gp10 family putative phage morphogenesis protein n=1 Tax=Pelagibacterium sp. TaxID=1967288 RepID=UPI002C6B93F6|nr:HK97-gp10 family putative phage morphogenesis protein [Pelagibacterium sp.]HWJ88515.1 HK97-gp10 family putative phage morphogenesis protein [Pelagibacterium sp.]